MQRQISGMQRQISVNAAKNIRYAATNIRYAAGMCCRRGRPPCTQAGLSFHSHSTPSLSSPSYSNNLGIGAMNLTASIKILFCKNSRMLEEILRMRRFLLKWLHYAYEVAAGGHKKIGRRGVFLLAEFYPWPPGMQWNDTCSI